MLFLHPSQEDEIEVLSKASEADKEHERTEANAPVEDEVSNDSKETTTASQMAIILPNAPLSSAAATGGKIYDPLKVHHLFLFFPSCPRLSSFFWHK